MSRRGLVLVLSSPSGAGKSTLAKHLLETDRDIQMSISVTTRPPRPGEQDGKDYHFISLEKFKEMQDNDELLESAMVFDNGYGTPRKPVEDWLASGRDVLFDIDWQGTQQVHEKLRDDLVRVFVLPPSAHDLHERLFNRAQDKASIIAKRMAEASSEISHWAEYDYVVINDNLATCQGEIAAILKSERLRRFRRVGLSAFVREMLEKL
ncbi:MAG TPA: guanylate kinase [Rhizobiales bacterium]|nr:guanylate kinase [Hyphomicrobiales bacterium]